MINHKRWHYGNYSSDIIIIEHLNDTEYKLTRGYRLPGQDKLKNSKNTKIKIEGNILNYKGKNYEAFSNNYEKLVFKEGVFKKYKWN